jgi:hypothetical protein
VRGSAATKPAFQHEEHEGYEEGFERDAMISLAKTQGSQKKKVQVYDFFASLRLRER